MPVASYKYVMLLPLPNCIFTDRFMWLVSLVKNKKKY